MLDFFISSETDKSVGDIFNNIRKEIEPKLKALEKNDYGDAVLNIGIIPIIVGQDLLDAGFFKERKLFSTKKKEADFRLKINLKRFLESDDKTRRLMVIKNIIQSIRSLGEKVKKNFDAKRLENDILNTLHVSNSEIDNIEI